MKKKIGMLNVTSGIPFALMILSVIFIFINVDNFIKKDVKSKKNTINLIIERGYNYNDEDCRLIARKDTSSDNTLATGLIVGAVMANSIAKK